MQPVSKANECQPPANTSEDNTLIPYPDLLTRFEKLSEAVTNPFKSNREFCKVFTSIQEKVEKTHGTTLELKQKLTYIKNCIEYQISEQQVGRQKADRVILLFSVYIVGMALIVWENFLPQGSTLLDYAKNIIFIATLVSLTFVPLALNSLHEIRKNQFCLYFIKDYLQSLDDAEQ